MTMIPDIDNRIAELKKYVEKQRELIIGLNNAIENDGFKPSESQQVSIDYICEQGQLGLKEIERLSKLKGNLNNV